MRGLLGQCLCVCACMFASICVLWGWSLRRLSERCFFLPRVFSRSHTNKYRADICADFVTVMRMVREGVSACATAPLELIIYRLDVYRWRVEQECVQR